MAYSSKFSDRSTAYIDKYGSARFGQPRARFGISRFGDRFGTGTGKPTYTDKFSDRSTTHTSKYTSRGTN